MSVLNVDINGVEKPSYHVSTMVEIAAIPWNGLTVVSTFSGCGGSCLGYRMAGFRVLWANEFVPIAQESYKANVSKHSYLDCRDIRKIHPEEILDQLKIQKGDLDIFDGSPPCQAFSMAGKRHKGWGKEKKYEHGIMQCNEQLFDEYIRLLRGLMPRVFVAENVTGLVKGVAKGMFLEILKDLKESGYRVQCRILDAQWLGVPQVRRRIIFMGVRNDLDIDPVFPNPLPYRYSVREAIPWMLEQPANSIFSDSRGDMKGSDEPSRTITSSGSSSSRCVVEGNKMDEDESASCSGKSAKFHSIERRKFTIFELKRICGFPDDFILIGSYKQQWERLGNSVPPVMMKYIAETIRDRILLI